MSYDMGGHELAQIMLRIPIRGYEAVRAANYRHHSLVTNPYKGL